MGIFKRRKADEAFKIQLEREAIDQMNRIDENDFMLPLELEGADSIWSINGKTKAPHSITADELMGHSAKTQTTTPVFSSGDEVEKISMSNTSADNETPTDFLYKRMTETRNQSLEQAVTASSKESVDEPKSPSTKEIADDNESGGTSQVNVENKNNTEAASNQPVKQNEPLDIDALIKSLRDEVMGNQKAESPSQQQSLEIETKSDTASQTSHDFDNNKTDDNTNTETASEINKESAPATPPAVDPQKAKLAEQRRTSLLARCNAYLEDEEFGTAKIDTEKYRLESVESILHDFETRASHRVMKNLNLNTPKNSSPKQNNIAEPPDKANDISNTTAFVIGADRPDTSVTEQPLVKHYFTAPVESTKNTAVPAEDTSATIIISDSDIEKITMKSSAPADDKTSIFSAIGSEEKSTSDNNTDEAYESETDNSNSTSYEDYQTVADRERIIEQLISHRKRYSLKLLLNILLLIPAIYLTTPIAEVLKAINPSLLYGIEAVICLLTICVNFDTIKGIGSIFSKESNTDLSAALSSVSVLIYSIITLIFKNGTVGLSCVSLISLLLNTLSKRSFYGQAIKNFNLIANTEQKRAIAIIKSKSATKAMVGNAIDGGSLICCGAKAINIKNFLKYTYCNNPVAGKIKNITYLGAFFSIILCVASLIITGGDIVSGLTVLTAVLCITAAPSTLLISQFPFKMAHNRLRLYDAMLTGYRAADELDLCNGVAVSCNALFPEGTIRLVDLKLLSPNPIDQSMMDAAALAEAIGSPIAGIFKQVNASSSYEKVIPKVDSFVYEDKMGISGWVDDRRVFVGNRVLMEAHGFTSLPPIELDKKIMRKGYFPIYIVSDNVPSALLVVKYVPDEEVAYELRRLCNTGTTVLVHNCDPNISSQMLCDYFGLYSETISVMSKQGSEIYDTITKQRSDIVAGAAYKGSVCGLFATLTAAINVKRSIVSMTALYVIAVIIGILAVGAAIFTSLFSYIGAVTLTIFQLTTTIIICLPPLLKRP